MKEAWDNAASIESYEGDHSDLEEVGRQQSRSRMEKEYVFFKDRNGKFWYQTVYQTPAGMISEYEYIFGKKPKRRRNKSS